jgi:hypothetical protein
VRGGGPVWTLPPQTPPAPRPSTAKPPTTPLNRSLTSPLTRALTRHTGLLALATATTFTSLGAHAALVARDLDGDTSSAEAYFDTLLGITWMRDARALSSAYGVAATLNYSNTLATLANFNADPLLNFGHSGWRLPGAAGVHTIGGAGCQFGFNGSTDCGTSVDSASSELAHLFHVSLGNLSDRDTSGGFRPGVSGIDFGLVQTGDFVGAAATPYWSGTASYRLIFGVPQHGQVSFHLGTGTQAIGSPTGLGGAWLVHDGDIGQALGAAGAVPLPGSLGLAALGLALLMRRRAA